MSQKACFFFTIHGRRNLPLESFGAHEGSCAKWLASLVGLAAVGSACKGERAVGGLIQLYTEICRKYTC